MTAHEDPRPRELNGGFRLGPWTVEPRLNRVRLGERVEQLESKAMDVLVALAARDGDVVSRTELLDAVWNGRYVTEHVLNRAISTLRRILGDGAEEPAVIETIRGRGYRLLLRVEPPSADATPTDDARMAPTGGPQDTAPVRRTRTRGPRPVAWLALGVVAASAVSAALLFTLRPDAASGSADGGSWVVQRVTSSHFEERDPSLTPDGSQIAYAMHRDGSYDIVVRSLGTESALFLTEGSADDREPAWSPDGSRLVFLRFEPGGAGVYMIPALGGEARRVAPYPWSDPLGLAWSPDGDHLILACAASRGRRPSLCRLDLQTLEVSPLIDNGGDRYADSQPSVSPDGRDVAFIRATLPGVEDLYVVARDGSRLRRLTFDSTDITGAAWESDGRHLVFSSRRAGVYGLWRIPVDGGAVQWVAGGGSKLKDPTAALRGSRIAAESWDLEINIWRYEVEPETAAGGGSARQAVVSTQWDYDPRISPDGRRVLFVSSRSGTEQIWLADTEGDDLERLSDVPAPGAGSPAWSPTGEAVVFVARPRGNADLFWLPLGSMVPRRLTTDPADDVAPSVSSDGRHVLFASRRTGEWQVWRIPVSGGSAEQVTANGGFLAREATDGRIYFSRMDRPGIWRLESDRSATRIVDRPFPADGRHWDLTRDGVYFVVREDGDSDRLPVHFAPFSGEGPRRVATIDSHTRGLSVAGDGSWLLASRIDRAQADIIAFQESAPEG